MRRRQFITLLGGAAAWPRMARAQQAMPLIGLMGSGSAAAQSHLTAAFLQRLRELGWGLSMGSLRRALRRAHRGRAVASLWRRLRSYCRELEPFELRQRFWPREAPRPASSRRPFLGRRVLCC
jgi:hypothetical protein